MKQFRYRFIAFFAALLLLTSCAQNPFQNADKEQTSSAEASTETKQEKEAAETSQPIPQEISIAGLPLMSYTPYTVYLEPTEACDPSFDPVYVTMEFASVNLCNLTYQGETISLSRLDNKKYIDLYANGDDPSKQLTINGKCDTECADADFAVRVSMFTQGENVPPVFGDHVNSFETGTGEGTLAEEEIPEEPVVLLAGDHLSHISYTIT